MLLLLRNTWLFLAPQKIRRNRFPMQDSRRNKYAGLFFFLFCWNYILKAFTFGVSVKKTPAAVAKWLSEIEFGTIHCRRRWTQSL